MPDNQTILRELLLPVAEGCGGRRGKATETALRDAIRSGRLAAHTRLPSSRDLARQLGVSRGTVTALYQQLTAEGYLVSKHGSGTTVAPLAAAGTPGHGHPPAPPRAWRFDLRTGLPALGAFPRAEWLAAGREALNAMPDAALGYPEVAGDPALRAELASYLGRVRALPTSADQIVITSGAAEALSLLASVLHASGQSRVAVEDPSHIGQAELLAAHGLQPVGVPVDEHGLDIARLADPRCRAVVTSAAHQYPLGVALAPQRRHALVEWARGNGGLVIEDDYDAEHRYDRPALGAMHALAPDRVAYLGSVSKVLAPALRIGWLVLPDWLRDDVIAAKRLHDLGCPSLPQAALAVLLRTGGYDRHLRRTRRLYRQRRDALLAALAEHLPGWQPHGIAAGLHVVIRLPPGTDDEEIRIRLAAGGINLSALSGYAHTDAGAPFPGLVIGYAATPPDRLRVAVAEMARIIRAR